MNTNIPINEIKKILIVRRGAIGDVVCFLPAVHAIKTTFPDIEISWLTHIRSLPAIKDHPDIDHTIAPDRDRMKHVKTFFQGLVAYINTIWSQSFKRYDLLILLNDKECLLNRLIIWWSGAKYRVGFDKTNPLVTHVCPVQNSHLSGCSLDMARFLGANVTDTNQRCFNIPIVAEYQKIVDTFLFENGIREGDVIIGLNSGAGANNSYSAAKRWHVERFAQLADMLSEQGHKVILFGGKIDKQRVDEITKRLKHPVISAQGKFNLSQLYSLLRKCNVFVTGDTGPMHMAVAVGTPVLALFGPTPPLFLGPTGKQDRTLYFASADNANIYALPHQSRWKREVRKGNCHPSFEPITAELVFQNVQEMLSEKLTQE